MKNLKELKPSVDFTALESPHQKSAHTTFFGRVVERASYFDLFAFAIIVLAVSAAYYCFGPDCQTLNVKEISYSGAFYFSLVTATSLGYGDISPIGFGRVVASLDVLLGLSVVAIFVGKIASERQQSVLYLLYTSDAQRRINDYSIRFYDLRVALLSALDSEDEVALKDITKDLASRFEIINKYLFFNLNQGKFLELGSGSALQALYYEFEMIQQACIAIHKRKPSEVVARRTLVLAGRLCGLMKLLYMFHADANNKSSYSVAFFRWLLSFCQIEYEVSDVTSAVKVLEIYGRVEKERELLREWVRVTVTPAMLASVYKVSPSGPVAQWPKSTHKLIAEELDISNNLAQRCLDELLASSKLPKHNMDECSAELANKSPVV